eukprot:TRINITY_DN21382_c0_g1_i1.p1 TRINITY_DN21382_c0_g1~~TRINITY_DN21382_c0_g1_i1.p1  ORF type:complete len:478 (+),score=110.42 TRINITY_DN21382_c0_g1_i1:90-1523(+)
MESSILDEGDTLLEEIDLSTKQNHEEQMERLKNGWEAWRHDMQVKQDELEVGEYQQSQYFCALEEDAIRLEHAAKELHCRLQLANEAIKKYQKKNRAQKQVIAQLREELASGETELKSLRKLNEVRVSSLEDVQNRYRSSIEGNETEKNRLIDKVAEKDLKLQEAEHEMEELRRTITQHDDTKRYDTGKDRKIQDLLHEVRSLEQKLATSTQSIDRLQVLHNTYEIKEKSLYIPCIENKGPMGGRTLTIAPDARAVRADRPIIRKHEADYWIPQKIFDFTCEFKKTCFPKASVDMFYEYLVQCSKIWRCQHAESVRQMERKHELEIESLRAKAGIRNRRLSEISAMVNLKDLKRQVMEANKAKHSGYVGREKFVKSLKVALGCAEDLAAQLTAAEEEILSLKTAVAHVAPQVTSELTCTFQSRSEHLRLEITTRCDEFQKLVADHHPHVAFITTDFLASITSAVAAFARDVPLLSYR